MPITYRASDKRFVAVCEEPNCLYKRSFINEPAAILESEAHSCPWTSTNPGGTKYSWSITVTLVEQLWAFLDAEYNDLVDQENPLTGDDLEFTKGLLRGLTKATLLFMTPHFKTEDEIVLEVVKRHDKRVAGERYDTPGLGSRIYEVSGDVGSKYKVRAVPTATPLGPNEFLLNPGVEQAGITIDKEKQEKIVKAWKSGQFKIDDMVEFFGLSADLINAIINKAE